MVFAVFVFVFASIFQMSMFTAVGSSMTIFSALRASSVAIALLAELMKGSYSSLSVIGIGIFACIAGISMNGGEPALAMALVLMVVARNFDFRLIAKAALAAMCVGCLVVVLSSFFGLIGDYVWTLQGRVRHGLGFRYTTYLSHYLLYGFLLYVYLTNGRPAWKILLLVSCLDVWIFILTDSRNSFVLTLLVVACCIFLRGWFKRTKPIKTTLPVFTLLYPVIAFASIALMVGYDPSVQWMRDFNTFLGSRLSIQHFTYQMYGSSPFGQVVSFVGQGLTTSLDRSLNVNGGVVTFIDNSYCNTYVRFGIFALLFFVVAFSTMMFKAGRSGNRVLVLIFCVIAVHSFVDSWWIAPQYDIFMFLIGPTLLGHVGKSAYEHS